VSRLRLKSTINQDRNLKQSGCSSSALIARYKLLNVDVLVRDSRGLASEYRAKLYYRKALFYITQKKGGENE
ncbi:MAG: hypothetical protein ACXV44_08140, partial [Halobacteriota archaeon]